MVSDVGFRLSNLLFMTLSVIICTHNPRADYLLRVLEALKAQTVSKEKWEFIVVDNRSDVPLSQGLDISWHPLSQIVREDALGQMPARIRGLKEAKAELMLFVDDDNVLAPDYLEQAVAIGATHPFLGVWGGAISPEFETPPAAWMKDFLHLLTCFEVAEDRWSNLKFNYATIPPTAGMCLRRTVAEAFIEMVTKDPRRQYLGRKGKHQLTGSEDMDLAFTACDIGLGTGQFKRLHLTHLIPSSRLTEDYLLHLAEGCAYSAHILHALRGRPPVPPRFSLYLRRLFWSKRRRKHFDGQLRALRQACKFIESWS